MIHIRNGSLAYGPQQLFNDLSLAFLQNQRIGVLGRNGTGKSTLLKLIAGLERFDEGFVELDKNKKIGYMPQEMVLLSTKSVKEEALTVFAAFQALEKEKQELELKLETSADADLVERYSVLMSEFNAYDGSLALERTEKILKGLGFTPKMFEQPVNELSVGWKMRLVLAKLLLEDADFYLFDEPTNHLDLPTKEWFFEFLKEGRFGYLMVSHDRHYLEKASDYILALEMGRARLFRGNLSAYLADQEQQREILESAYERQQKEIARKEATIERFRAKASKARMAQSMIKQLEKVERIELEPILPTLKVKFPSGVRPGNQVLTIESVAHTFDEKLLFSGVKGTVVRGDRVALIAPNGTGKTTLFNLICGKYPLQKGAVSFGHNVEHAIFEQDQMRALNGNNTIIEEVLQAVPDVSEALIRAMLGAFLFSGDTIYKKISVLSGGERNRVAMVKVLLQKANLLLLDEPTNHLDLTAKELLLQALLQYGGTMVFVSHDQSFLEGLATRIWELTPTGIIDYPGNFESYREFKKAGAYGSGSVKEPEGSTVSTSAMPVKESFRNRKEIGALETKIMKVEKEIEALNHSFFELTYGTPEYEKAAIKLKEKQGVLVELMTRWESLTN